MQISKGTHLKKLLRTQDVAISLLSFLLALNFVWYVDIVTLDSVLTHLTLLPFVAFFSWLVTQFAHPGIHGMSVFRITFLLIQHAAIVVVGVLAIAYFAKLDFVSRYLLVLYGSLLVTGILINRLFLKWWYFSGRREHPENFLQVLVIGSGNRAATLVDAYVGNSEWGVKIIGMLDPNPDTAQSTIDGVPLLGGLQQISRILTDEVIDEVIICLPRSMLDDVPELVEKCAEEAVCVKYLADLFPVEGAQYNLQHIGSWPVLSIDPVARQEHSLIFKRIVDILLTIPGLLVLAPLLLITAVLIKLDSPGPVFFRQTRVGLNKRKFKMIKFRSMYEDAEAKLNEIEHLNEAEGPIFKIQNDPRITRVGRVIRRTSIDELPQLLNVVFGHMSLIGPRPMSTRDVERFSKGIQRARFSVRPGLACLREVSGRSALSFEQWLELDLKYINEWSLGLDLKILLLLIPAVIKGDGAS